MTGVSFGRRSAPTIRPLHNRNLPETRIWHQNGDNADSGKTHDRGLALWAGSLCLLGAANASSTRHFKHCAAEREWESWTEN